jgi:hypothetical protein
MKKIIALLALGIGFSVMTPVASQARDHHENSSTFSHRCGACGSSVYRQRVITGHDRHGHPSYAWRALSHNCRPAHGGHGGNYGQHGGSHGRGHSNPPDFHMGFGARGHH